MGFLDANSYAQLSQTCGKLRSIITHKLLRQVAHKWRTQLKTSDLTRQQLFAEIHELQIGRLFGYIPRWFYFDCQYETIGWGNDKQNQNISWPGCLNNNGEVMHYWGDGPYDNSFGFPKKSDTLPARGHICRATRLCFIGQDDIAFCEKVNSVDHQGGDPEDFYPVCWTSCIRPVRFKDSKEGFVDVYAVHRYPDQPPNRLWRRVGSSLRECEGYTPVVQHQRNVQFV